MLCCKISALKLRLTLIQKGVFYPLRLLPVLTKFSVFIHVQSVTPGNSWLGRISLKDFKIIWRKNEGNLNKIIFGDFNCTIERLDRECDVVPITLIEEILFGEIFANFGQIHGNKSKEISNFVHSRK